jgi:hypothetical protein
MAQIAEPIPNPAQNIRVVHHRSYQHLTGYPPRQERLRSRSAADFRKSGLSGLKLARDDLAGGVPA